MGNTAIKICGLQSVAMLESMRNLPIEYIGFILAKSKRQVSPLQAKEMIDFLAADDSLHTVQTVGVFMNPTTELLSATLKQAPLHAIQLHGQESAELCKWIKETLGVKVIKVFSVADTPEMTSFASQLQPYRNVIDAVLLDTYDPIVGGGTGKRFAWERIPSYQEVVSTFNLPLIIAGGLNNDNIEQLISIYKPEGVDVSSGVETDGIKDIHKIISFVERVRSHG